MPSGRNRLSSVGVSTTSTWESSVSAVRARLPGGGWKCVSPGSSSDDETIGRFAEDLRLVADG